MSRRTFYAAFLVGAALIVAGASPAVPQASTDVDRSVEPVILQGQNIPVWSRLPALGFANTYPSGTNDQPPFPVPEEFLVRDAHNGQLVEPEDARNVMPEDIVGFRWTGTGWQEIPIQIDQRFPYFLANTRSDFGFYSGTDEELTYQWDVESWKKVQGQCRARYPQGAEPDPSIRSGYPTLDPIEQFDDDDELVFMASDAGEPAPFDAPAPAGAGEAHQEITLTDPLGGAQSYVYLFLRDSGPTFDASNGYIDYRRDADADQWIDRASFPNGSTEQLGSSNTGYGPNLPGTVCDDGVTPRDSTDRFPRDGVTVSTDAYRWRATGRWMVREMHVARGTKVEGCMRLNSCLYGADLIDRWKGRAFQQAPDSSVSLVGFEDEQVNWEANSALLGERTGPVRAIREVWGADSGTNTTKREYFYRDSIVNRYFLRVHPIPPDGLYTSWDHNAGTVATYYNEQTSGGVAVDGENDDEGNVDEEPVTGTPAYFDATDPTFSRPISLFNWEQVAGTGNNGSVVYMFQLNNITGAQTPQVIPYYRDDQCFDDGTGDDPIPRPWPGEAQSDGRLDAYRNLNCNDEPPPKQGCFACHGIHYLITNDTDNAFLLKPTTEVDGQQYQWAAPTSAPDNVGDPYANTVKFALQPLAVLIPTSGTEPSPSPSASGSASPSSDPPPSISPSAGSSPPASPSASSSTGGGPSSSPGPSGSIPPGSTDPSPGSSTSPGGPGSSPPATIGPGGATGPGSPSPSPSASPEPSFAQGDPEGHVTTTIESESSKVALMEPTVFSGKIGATGKCDGPFDVSLYRKQFGEEIFTQVATVRNLRVGDVWNQRAAARLNSQFVARVDGPADDVTPCRADFSDPATLLVKVKIRVIHTGPCRGPHRVNGSIRPSQPGTKVFLRSVGGLGRVDKDRLGQPSRFSLRVPDCGRYEVAWPKQGQRNIGNSIGA